MAKSDANSAEFAVVLKDDTSGPAQSAGKALEDLKGKITADTKELRAMQAAMRALKGGTVTNVAAFRSLRDRIAAQKATIANAQSSFVSLGGSFGEGAKEAAGATRSLASLTDIAQRMPGPLGGIVSRLGSMRALLAGGVIAGAVVGIVAALAALVVASAAAAAALLRYGIAQSDARRSELLRLEGLTTLRSYYGLAAGSATEMQAAIDRVSDSSALGRDRIAGMSQELYRAGLRGSALSNTLEALAMVESVQGAAGVRRMRGRLIADGRAGRSAQRLADTQARLGGIAARQAMGLDRQMTRLRENVSRIFDGLKIEGLLRGLHEVTSLFSQQTATGRALKAMFEALFQPLVNTLTEGAPLARRFFQGMVIGALLLTIAIQRVGRWMAKTFGDSTILGSIDAQRAALIAGAVVVGLFAAGLVLAAGAFAALAASAALVFAPIAIAIGLAIALGAAVGTAVRAFMDADWRGIGLGIVTGIVTGLTLGRDRLISAMRGLAAAARSALTDALEIRSPSRVFADLGRQIPAGLAVGVDAGAGDAQAAVDGMVAPSAPGRAGSRSSSASVSIGEIHIHTRATDAQGIAADIGDAVRELFQGLALEEEAPA